MLTRFMLLSLAVILAATPVAASNEIPSVMRDRDDPAFWIAAEEAVGPDGKLNEKAMGRLAFMVTDHLERQRERRKNAGEPRNGAARKRPAGWPELEGCESFFGSVPQHYKPTRSLTDLSTHADAIVTGRIVAMRQGFLGGEPGSLLLLEPEYLKGKPGSATYLFYPLARIRTVDGFLCGVPVGSFVPPSVGDRLLLFSMTGGHQLDSGTVFNVRTARELVHEPRKGSLQLPAALTPFTAPAEPRFDDVLDAVRNSLARLCNEAQR